MKGEVKGTGSSNIPTSMTEKRTSKWRLFQGKGSENKSKASDKQVSTGKLNKRDKKQKKISKVRR